MGVFSEKVNFKFYLQCTCVHKENVNVLSKRKKVALKV